MDIFRYYKIDILVSKNVLKWEDVKILLITKKITILLDKNER